MKSGFKGQKRDTHCRKTGQRKNQVGQGFDQHGNHMADNHGDEKTNAENRPKKRLQGNNVMQSGRYAHRERHVDTQSKQMAQIKLRLHRGANDIEHDKRGDKAKQLRPIG